VPSSSEEGFVLVEVIVSAMIITIAAIGIFSAFTAAEKSTADERHQAQAHGLAQADIARMRTMRISQLSPTLSETKTVTLEGTPYTVNSDAQFINAKTGTDTCDEKEASADYIRIRSTITWPGIGSRPAVIETSLVAPPNSTVRAESGALIVQVEDGEEHLIPGIPISGDGPTPFSRETGENGCAVFGNLLEGEYEVNATVPGLVDPDGDESGTTKTSVVAEATKTLKLQYDTPGLLKARFFARFEGSSGKKTPVNAQAITLFNTGMSEARSFQSKIEPPTYLGNPVSELEATSLFPFDDGYTVYAGACEANNPNPDGKHPSEAVVQATVAPGGEAEVELELPVLHLQVYKSEKGKTKEKAGAVEGSVWDTNCPSSSLPAIKFTTNSEGAVNIPLPFSMVEPGEAAYTVCAVGTANDGNRRLREEREISDPASLTNVPAGGTGSVYLRSGSKSSSGKCP
jgi:Tfp pilus assembly protein PilV